MPETPNGEKSVSSGITLDISPVVKDGRITISGKSVVRRRMIQDAPQPLGAISFATHETFFSGAVQDGNELIIAVGDGVMVVPTSVEAEAVERYGFVPLGRTAECCVELYLITAECRLQHPALALLARKPARISKPPRRPALPRRTDPHRRS